MIPSLQNYIECNRLNSLQEKFYFDSLERNRDYEFNKTSVDSGEYNLILERLKFNNISKFNLSFDSCATNIINELFDKYVDDETLVLTTDSEHDSVLNNLKKCKNTDIIISHLTLNKSALERCRGFKKVFVYIIGTYCATGFIVADSFLKTIKSYLTTNNIKHTLVLDAVQEMFLFPRDYSMFDYVIGTAHALIPNYNMGILLSKEERKSYPDKGTLLEFNSLLSMLPDLSNFNNLMRMNFNYLLNTELKMSYGATHLFSIGDETGILLPLIEKQDQEKQNRGYYSVNFRGCWFRFGVDTFINLIKRTEKFLELIGFTKDE